MTKVSIIVPVYNVEKYIDRCLNTLINQTLKDIEILIINDGSPDNSINICEKYALKDNRIKIYSKENEGLGLTRNYGIERATGEYISFVDSDDYVSLDMCEKLYNSARKYNADIVYGGIYYDNNNKIIQKKCVEKDKIWDEKKEVKSLLLDFIATKPEEKNDTIMEVSVWKALFKKDIFDKNNIRFVSERVFISEDVIFDIDFFLNSKRIVAIPDCVYYYVVNPNSLSKTFRTDRFSKVKILYNEIIRRLKENYTEEEYKLRTDRFLIARARTNIKKIVKHKKVIGKEEMYKALNEICNDKDLGEILDRYPIYKLPVKYAISSFLIKYKMYKIIELIF